MFPEFDPEVHVQAFEPAAAGVTWIGGLDFGLRAPTVFLWAVMDGQGVIRVVDEHVASDAAAEQHVQAVSRRPWPRVAWVGADPAGNQDSYVARVSPARIWREGGYRVRTTPSRIEDGLRRIRALMQPASGPVRLFIHPRCHHLIASIQRYHYREDSPSSTSPVKDGADHAVDALRYMIIHAWSSDGKTRMKTYW